jgi:ketosteroid isomerase-like protein
MIRIAAVALALAAAACSHGQHADSAPPRPPATPQEVVAAGRATVESWRQAYELRAIDALAKLYPHDLDVIVVQDGAPYIGWSSVEAMLRDRLARAKQVHVRLKDLKVTSLAPTVAAAVATMTREIGDGVTTVTENGALTLVLRKDDAGGWLIVGEHYSYKRAGG